ncbi:MAG TPA: glycosyltransferase [Planctomycetaceae bacterium]|jgi:glycosyltransferase involved in cell wall biosynthesis|nr:glycosyltransferase [Planctomycetaceae bacterium]
MPAVSVITCTHNPRTECLSETLASLQAQTLPKDRWELLVLDNASREPVRDRFGLDWHPQARHLCEPMVGKTNAVLKGIRESRGDLIVLVDDDNVLAADYLEQAERISGGWPKIGAWGGSIVARYESRPPDWIKAYECYLSVREIKADQWFNLSFPELYGNLPYGAGMCVRRIVAAEYARLIEADEVRRRLDRCGDSLVSSGDTDFALVACDMGFGVGLFANLKLTHLVHKGRLTEQYLERMLRDMNYSLRLLAARRGQALSRSSWLRRSWESVAAWRRGPREFRFYRATMDGLKTADAEVRRWGRHEA